MRYRSGLDTVGLANLGHNAIADLLLEGIVTLLVTAPLSALGVLEDALWLLTDHFVGDLGRLGLLGLLGLSTDGSMNLGVAFLNVLELASSEALLPLAELSIKATLILLLELVEIFLDVATVDVITENLDLEIILPDNLSSGLAALVLGSLFLGNRVAREALVLVRNQETTIGSTLHNTEGTVASG